MTPEVSTKERLERIFHNRDPSGCTPQDWSQVEVDLVVLFKELTILAGYCGRIVDSFPVRRLSGQELQ